MINPFNLKEVETWGNLKELCLNHRFPYWTLIRKKLPIYYKSRLILRIPYKGKNSDVNNDFQMNKDNSVGFRIPLIQCRDPQKLCKEVTPKNQINMLWKGLPSNTSPEIWFWFEFNNQAQKSEYIRWLEVSNISFRGEDGCDRFAKDVFMHDDPVPTEDDLNEMFEEYKNSLLYYNNKKND